MRGAESAGDRGDYVLIDRTTLGSANDGDTPPAEAGTGDQHLAWCSLVEEDRARDGTGTTDLGLLLSQLLASSDPKEIDRFWIDFFNATGCFAGYDKEQLRDLFIALNRESAGALQVRFWIQAAPRVVDPGELGLASHRSAACTIPSVVTIDQGLPGLSTALAVLADDHRASLAALSAEVLLQVYPQLRDQVMGAALRNWIFQLRLCEAISVLEEGHCDMVLRDLMLSTCENQEGSHSVTDREGREKVALGVMRFLLRESDGRGFWTSGAHYLSARLPPEACPGYMFLEDLRGDIAARGDRIELLAAGWDEISASSHPALQYLLFAFAGLLRDTGITANYYTKWEKMRSVAEARRKTILGYENLYQIAVANSGYAAPDASSLFELYSRPSDGSPGDEARIRNAVSALGLYVERASVGEVGLLTEGEEEKYASIFLELLDSGENRSVEKAIGMLVRARDAPLSLIDRMQVCTRMQELRKLISEHFTRWAPAPVTIRYLQQRCR